MVEPARPAAGIGGLILAGGRGARMGEADKGWVELAGRPLVAHVAARLAPQVDALLVSANRNADRYAAYGRVVPDAPALDAWSGPLAGVAAGLAAWTGEWLVTVPCDTPFLPTDLAARLLAAAHAAGAPLAVAAAGGRRHSVCMAVRTALLADLDDYLRGGERKVELWQARVGAVEVVFNEDPGAFLNVNTPQDLAVARRFLG